MIKLSKVKWIPKCQAIFENKAMAMELYGQTIEQVFEAYEHKFPISTVVEIGNQMINALNSVHKLGLVHGNITPHTIAVGSYKSMFLLHTGEYAAISTVEDDFTNLFSVLVYLESGRYPETGDPISLVKDPTLKELMRTRTPQSEKPLVWIKDQRDFFTPRANNSPIFTPPVCGFHWDITDPSTRYAAYAKHLQAVHDMASDMLNASLPIRWIVPVPVEAKIIVISVKQNPYLMVRNRFTPGTQFIVNCGSRFPRAMGFCGSRLFAFGNHVIHPTLGASLTMDALKNVVAIADGMVATEDGTVAVRLTSTTEVCRVRGQVLAFARLDPDTCFVLTDAGFLYRITAAAIRGTQLADSFSSRRTTAIVASSTYVAIVGAHGAIFVRQTPRMQLLHRTAEPVLAAKFVDKRTCFLVSSCQLTMINLRLGQQRHQPVPLIYRAVIDDMNRIHCIAKRELAEMFTDRHYTTMPPFNGAFLVSPDGMASVIGVDPRSPWLIEGAVYTTLHVVHMTTDESVVLGKRKLETEPPIRPPEPGPELSVRDTSGLELLADTAVDFEKKKFHETLQFK